MPTLKLPVTECYSAVNETDGSTRFTLNEYLNAGIHGWGLAAFQKITVPTLTVRTFVSLKLFFLSNGGGHGSVCANSLLQRVNELLPQNINAGSDMAWDTGTGVNGQYVFTITDISAATRILQNGCQLTGGGGNTFYSRRVSVEAYRPYAEFIYYSESDPPTCSVEFPLNVAIDGSKDTEFRWDYVQCLDVAQSHFDIQYSINGLNWTDIFIKKPWAQHNCIVPAETLPAGILYWRVRTYSGNGQYASAWSEPSKIGVKNAPPTPRIISVSNAARPKIAWTSSGQEGYEIEIMSGSAACYSAGEASQGKIHQVTAYLDNGSYTARLRVVNSYGLYSAWTSFAFAVSVQKPDAPGITALSIKNGVRLLISAVSGKVYLLRDGVPIAQVSGAQYDDFTAVGKHGYSLRLVDSADSYSDSKEVQAETFLDGYTLALITKPSEYIQLRFRRDPITRSGTLRVEGQSTFYTGREYPVYVFSPHGTETLDIEFSVSHSDFERVRQMIRQREPLLFRHKIEGTMIGILSSLDYRSDRRGVVFSATLERVDYPASIQYDGVTG